MVRKEVMSVTWNTHDNVLMSVFESLLKTQTLVDCTLAAEGKSIKAHKVIVSACSPYLKSLLAGASDTHPILILNDTKYSELVSLVEYMYKGTVELPMGKVESFVKAAKALEISGVSGSEEDKEEIDEALSSGPIASLLSGGKSLRRRRELDEDGEGKAEKRARVSAETPTTRSPSLTPSTIKTEDGNIEIAAPEPDAQSSDGGDDWEPQPGSSREDDEGDDVKESSAALNSFESNNEETVIEMVEEEEEEEKIALIVIHDENDAEAGKSQRHSCPQCGSECQDVQALRRHLRRHSRDANQFPFRCDKCQTPFKLQRTLDVHKEWECGKEPSFECSICSKRFHLERYLKQHERKHFGKLAPDCTLPPHICFDCGHVFKQRSQLDAHHRWECGKEPSFECEVCGDKFHYKVYLNEHKLATHSEATLELGPIEPGAITLTQEPIGDDLLPESGGYRCELCPRSFTRIGSLNYHVSRKHSGKAVEMQRDPQLYPFSCPRCGNRYRNSTQLSRHRKWECGKGPMFQCTLCVKRFHHRHALKQHLQLHSVGGGAGGRRRGGAGQQMQFCCDKCGKGYKLKSSLNNHARWECGKEPVFACTVCLVRFSHKGNLKKHILTKHIRSPDDEVASVDNLLVQTQPSLPDPHKIDLD